MNAEPFQPATALPIKMSFHPSQRQFFTLITVVFAGFACSSAKDGNTSALQGGTIQSSGGAGGNAQGSGGAGGTTSVVSGTGGATLPPGATGGTISPASRSGGSTSVPGGTGGMTTVPGGTGGTWIRRYSALVFCESRGFLGAHG